MAGNSASSSPEHPTRCRLAVWKSELIAIAYVLIRDGGKRLCEGYEKQIKTVKVYRF